MSTEPAAQRATILLVDDSALSRRTLRAILESEGYRIIEAADGLSAIERYSVDRPDLVLLDLLMPGIQGVEVLSKLKEIDGEARVIVASADIQRTTREQALAAGAAAYMTKPFERDIVNSTVMGILQGGSHGDQ